LGGEGKVYESCGFKFDGYTLGEYWYTDFQNRYHRFQYRAQKDMTGREYAFSEGVTRIYGVGSAKYFLEV